MNKRITLTFPVFGYVLKVIFSKDVEATGRKMKEDLSNADGGFIDKDTHPLQGWIILGRKPNEGTIAHEVSHAVRHIMTSIGAGLDDEIVAYHQDYIVRKIHKALRR